MALSVQVPTIGQANSTEAVKVTNSLTNLSAWANGNVQDTDLNSPNNGVRKLLLEAGGVASGATVGGTYLFMGASTTLYTSGTINGNSPIPMWIPDQGLSSQPTDFQVANKAAFCRLRVTVCVNTTAPAITFTFGLYQLSTLGGAGNGNISYTFSGTALSGSTVASVSPAATVAPLIESGQFAMPTSGNPFAIGVNLSGTPTANSTVSFWAQLFAYNA